MAAARPTLFANLAETDRHESLADLVGAAALAPAAWPALLAHVAATFGAVGAAIVVQAARRDAAPAFWRVSAGWTGRPGVSTVVAARMAWPEPRREIHATDGDGLAGDDLGVVMLATDDDRNAALVLQRDEAAGPFTPTELRRAEVLAHDLRSAFATARRIEALARERDALAAALDQLPLGVVLLDRDGGVVSVNGAARALVDAGESLTIKRGTLAAASDMDATRLRRAVRAAPQTARPIALRIGRRNGSPCFVRLARLSTADAVSADETPAAVAIIADPDADLAALGPVLRDHYDLTPAEIDVTMRLLSGARVEAIAHDLDVSANTVRTHLKRTFSKLDVTSQSELVRVIARGPAAVTVGLGAQGTIHTAR